MSTRIKKVVLALSITMLSLASFALIGLDSRGTWPSSWPKELDPFRRGVSTIAVANGTQETWYEIPISTRQEFQKVWPHILSLRSKESRIILKSGPTTNFANHVFKTGVRVLWPPNGSSRFADGAELKPQAPWPDSARLPNGELAEYVMERNGTWVPAPGPGGWRARVDIVVVLDGNVIARSDVVVPAGTTVIDKRQTGHTRGGGNGKPEQKE